MKLDDFNKFVAGMGYQFFPVKTKTHSDRIRVENEDGVFLAYSENIITALKKYLPFGAKDKNFDRCLKIASKELYADLSKWGDIFPHYRK